ncbi:hypothetical protein BCR44DRAFT_1490646, partial [Catenaria anguillulae PL171]
MSSPPPSSSRAFHSKGVPPPSQSLANTFLALDSNSNSLSTSPPSKSNLLSMPMMDPRFGKEHAGLLRLFKSDFFNEWMAVYYLFKYADHDGIQHYLCDQLRYKFPASAVLEFLPQLCHILVVNPGMTHLESLLVNRCRASTHFALLTMWYFESYLSDLANVPDSLAHMMCSRVMATVESIIHASPDADSDVDTSSLPPSTPFAERSAAAVAAAAIDPYSGDLSSLSPKSTSLPRPSSTAGSTASPPISSTQPNTSTSLPRNGTTASSNSVKRSSGGGGGGGGLGSRSNSPRNSISMTNGPAAVGSRGSLSNLARLPSQSPSLEDLHKGKAFSFSHFVQRVASTAGSAAGSQYNSQPGSKRSSAASSNGSLAEVDLHHQSAAASDTPRSATLDPSLLKHYYFHSELQFMAALVAISERLVAVPREARQSSLTAELTLLNHNFPAPVCIPLWCLADTVDGASGSSRAHHQIVRISPSDAVVLNSADRVPFLLFVEVLDDDGDEDDKPLVSAKGTDLAAIKKAQASASAKDLAVAVAMVENAASSTSTSSSTTANVDRPTSAPAPSRPLVRRRSSLSLLPTALVIPPPTAVETDAEPAPTSAPPVSASAAPPIASSIRKSPSTPAIRDISLKNMASAPIVPGFITHAEFEDRMRTAAIMLAQLSLQEQQQISLGLAGGANGKHPAAVNKRSSTASASSAASAAAKLTEEIRSRILKEMMALEERRLQAVRDWHAAQERARLLEEEEQDGESGGWEHVSEEDEEGHAAEEQEDEHGQGSSSSGRGMKRI